MPVQGDSLPGQDGATPGQSDVLSQDGGVLGQGCVCQDRIMLC